jgi:hypothetical protein
MWRGILFAAALNLAVSGVAWANHQPNHNPGGESNNTTCNGQGNPNSPCEGVTNNGGNAASSASAKAKANAKATATATQKQGQIQGQSQTVNSTVTVQGDRNKASAVPPSASAPALTAGGSEICMGSTSVGLSGGVAIGGGGLSFGKTYTDTNCNRRRNALYLSQLGYPEAALILLARDPEVAEALRQAGHKAVWLSEAVLIVNTPQSDSMSEISVR